MKRLIEQAVHFIGISGIGWLLDFSIYTALGFTSANLVLNNIISSWVGVTFVFCVATGRVFKNSSKIPLKLKYLIYILYQCIFIFFISKLLDYVNALIVINITAGLIVEFSTIISKIFVTPITMALNFCVMKGVIEKL